MYWGEAFAHNREQPSSNENLVKSVQVIGTYGACSVRTASRNSRGLRASFFNLQTKLRRHKRGGAVGSGVTPKSGGLYARRGRFGGVIALLASASALAAGPGGSGYKPFNTPGTHSPKLP